MDDDVKKTEDGFIYKCIGCQQWIPLNEEIYLPSLEGCFCSSCAKKSDYKEPCTECKKPFPLDELTFEVDADCPLCKPCAQSWDHGYQLFLDKIGFSPRKLALIQMLCHTFLVQSGYTVELPEQFSWGITRELLQRLAPRFDKWVASGEVPLAIRIADLVRTDQLVKDMRHLTPQDSS